MFEYKQKIQGLCSEQGWCSEYGLDTLAIILLRASCKLMFILKKGTTWMVLPLSLFWMRMWLSCYSAWENLWHNIKSIFLDFNEFLNLVNLSLYLWGS